jgi:3-methyl-2-oxobutanoate hydroxymethyltransferase
MARRRTVLELKETYEEGTPLTAVTCYDYTFARLVESADLDITLVGDSLGNVVQGRDTTLPVTLDDIIYHSRAVRRAGGQAHLVADMPFMSYQSSEAEGMNSAGRLMKEAGVQSVKIEGGQRVAPLIDRMTDAGIPVMGHLGLTPQSVHQFGGYKVQGRGESGDEMIEDARALEEAGIYSLVLEMVPADLAERITEAIDVPTIGIGAGPSTDGQVLVLQDLLGLDTSFKPKFLKRYADLEETVVDALKRYRDEVREGEFPTDDHAW